MTDSTLKLFRRHVKTCSEQHSKDFRVFEGDSLAKTGKAQCNCSIYAEGTLRRDGQKKFLRPTNTGKATWHDARAVMEQWISWFGTKPPVPLQGNPIYELVTVDQAIGQFLALCAENKTSQDRIRQYRQLLITRLKNFVRKRNEKNSSISREIKFIQEMDNAAVWG